MSSSISTRTSTPLKMLPMKPANKWGFAGGFEVEGDFSATRFGVNFDVGGVALERVDGH
jgi:hypothetical protein